MTSNHYDPVETSTIGSSSLASDTSTISHDFQQGVGRSLYGIMRSAGARLEHRVDLFRESRTRQSLFRRSKAPREDRKDDWGVYYEVDPLLDLELAASKSVGILPWTEHSLLPSSSQSIAPDIASRFHSHDEAPARFRVPTPPHSEDETTTTDVLPISSSFQDPAPLAKEAATANIPSQRETESSALGQVSSQVFTGSQPATSSPTPKLRRVQPKYSASIRGMHTASKSEPIVASSSRLRPKTHLRPISTGSGETAILAEPSGTPIVGDTSETHIPYPLEMSEDFAEFKSKSWRPPSPTDSLSSTQAILNFPHSKYPYERVSIVKPRRPPARKGVLLEPARPARVTTASRSSNALFGSRAGVTRVSRNGKPEILTTKQPDGSTSRSSRLSSDSYTLYWDDIFDLSKKTISLHVYHGQHHLVELESEATVADIQESLKRLDFPGPGRSIYLSERGYERLLVSSEVPAEIVRKRLEQAGYCAEDGSELLVGKQLDFLLTFLCKDDEQYRNTSNFRPLNLEDINLSANGLLTIPSSLIKNASSIVTLDLSRNPLRNIPREFLRFAVRLRNLSLSNTGLTSVSSSLRCARNLRNLNLSGNRLTTLRDACFNELPSLTVLNLSDNLLHSLPDHIIYLRSLRTLNISHNNFAEIPSEITLLFALQILDVSYNMITQLPELLGDLDDLEELICAGNQIAHMPDNIICLKKLRLLYCQRNRIERLGGILRLPVLRSLRADHNSLTCLELPEDGHPYNADPRTASDMASPSPSLLRFLNISYNRLTSLPASISHLAHLEGLECSNNLLTDFPSNLWHLRKLRWLELHNNRINVLPATLWDCVSLRRLNLTNNLLEAWLNPWVPAVSSAGMEGSAEEGGENLVLRPPLVDSLQILHLGHNRLDPTRITTLAPLTALRVLNLSFNMLGAIPTDFFRRSIDLEELHLGGNELPDLVFVHDLLELCSLSKLYLNGNCFRTVPKELRSIKTLRILDLGSNNLGVGDKKDWDWGWGLQENLVYLNLSGNICLPCSMEFPRSFEADYEASLGLSPIKFSGLTCLYLPNVRALGLLGITNLIGFDIDKGKAWVRYTNSVIGGMSYGLADTMDPAGEYRFLDLFYHPPARPRCSLFALFGREVSDPELTSHTLQYLHCRLTERFNDHLLKNHDIEVSLRQTFLQLNQDLHQHLQTEARTASSAPHANQPVGGASVVILYFTETHLWAANVGDSEAVISRRGVADTLTHLHTPHELHEKERILQTGGYISPSFLADEVGTSRSFGHFHLFPSIISTPEIRKVEISREDEFVIIANRAFWELVKPQVAVDIARPILCSRTGLQDVRTAHIASQALRDLAIGCGTDQDLIVIVIIIADISMAPLRPGPPEPMLLPVDPGFERTSVSLTSLGAEVPLSPTDGVFVLAIISNAASFVELKNVMPVAENLLFQCLRRYLRKCGGFEIKADAQSFLCGFSDVLSAIQWCLTCQLMLLDEPWPAEILAHEAGQTSFDASGCRIAGGLATRMAVHSGNLYAEDSIIGRGSRASMINKVVALQTKAQSGQIVCSSCVMGEVEEAFGKTWRDGQPDDDLAPAFRAIQETGIVVASEVLAPQDQDATESIFVLYPTPLRERHSDQLRLCSLDPMYILVQTVGLLCLRLETLIEGKVFRVQTGANEERENVNDLFYFDDPTTLLPSITEQSSQATLHYLLNQFSFRILNALSSLQV